MTISSADRVAGPFTGNSVATSFPFNYKVFVRSDVIALLSDGQVETPLVLDSNFTVALNADQNANPGGTVTYPISGSPMTSAYTLTLSSDLDELQPVSLTNNGGFYPKVIENAFDRCVILLQQLRAAVDRTLRFPLSDTGVDTELPTQAARANNLLGFDAAGRPTAYIPSAQSAAAVMATLSGVNGVTYVGNAVDGRSLLSSIGSTLMGFIQAGIGAILRTAQAKLREHVSADDYGADPTGVADSSPAILAAAAAGARTIIFPGASYKLLSPVDLTGVNLRGAGQDKTTITAGAAMAYMFKMTGRIRIDDMYLQGAGLANNCLQFVGANGADVSHVRIESAKYDNVTVLASGNNNSLCFSTCLMRGCGIVYGTGTSAGVNGGSTITLTGAADLTTFVRPGKDLWKSAADAGGYAREITAVTANTITVFPALVNTFSGSVYSILQGSNIMVERHSDNNRIIVDKCTLQTAKVAGIYDQGLYGVVSRSSTIEINEYGRIFGHRGLGNIVYGGSEDNNYYEGSVSYDLLYAYTGGNSMLIGGIGQFGATTVEQSKLIFSGSAGPIVFASSPQSYAYANGLVFPAVQVPSASPNVLDDYEEGTWTPADNSGASLVFTGVSGTYTKIGNLVTVTGKVTYPVTATGNTAFISGLPFPQAAPLNFGGYVTANDSATAMMISAYSVAVVQPKSMVGAVVANSALSAKTIAFTFTYYN